jgi:hypothetical protein
MALNPKMARISTTAEEQLLRASLPGNVKALSTAQLKTDVRRARKLRNKYRTQARRHAAERRGKRLPRGKRPAGRNANTRVKAEAFDKALARFERQLEVKRAPKKSARKARARRTRLDAFPAARRAQKAVRRRGAALRAKSQATRAKRSQKKQQQMNLKRRQAFISSRMRRHDARDR